jgi:hypothetical protein
MTPDVPDVRPNENSLVTLVLGKEDIAGKRKTASNGMVGKRKSVLNNPNISSGRRRSDDFFFMPLANNRVFQIPFLMADLFQMFGD